jgi:radical SAM protein with 4Fe4S-binding SPASM domain
MLGLFFYNHLIYKIQKYFYKISVIPKEIILEITDRCNLSCDFCFNKLYVAKKRDGKELDTKSIKQIIDKVKASGVKIIRFTGGEPLLREDIFEVIEYAYGKGLHVWLNTNATLINKKNVEKITQYVNNILVPLSSFDNESEKRITGQNNFRRKIKGVLLLKEYRVRYLRCGTIVNKSTIANLERIYALINRVGVSSWELYRAIPLSRDRLPLNNDDIKILVEKLITINKTSRKKYKIRNAIPFCSYEPEKIKNVSTGGITDDGHNRFAIDSSGYAKPMYYFNENIGDISQESIMTIWNKKFMKDMRALRFIPDICKRCRYVRICKGGSRITSKIVGGDYKALDYLAQPDKYRYILSR